MDFLDVCEEPSIQSNLVFSQKEKAIRENWQTAVAACTGNNTQTQAKKKTRPQKETNTRKQSKESVSVIHWLDCYSHRNIGIYIMMLETSKGCMNQLYITFTAWTLCTGSTSKQSLFYQRSSLICVALQLFPKEK